MSNDKLVQLEAVEKIVEDHDLWDDINIYFNSKSWYKSKMILFNISVAMATGAGSLLYDANFKELMGEHYALMLTLVTMANVYLRTLTDSKVTA